MRRSRRARRDACITWALACVGGALGLALAPTQELPAQQTVPVAIAPQRDTANAATHESSWHLEQCMAGLTYGAPMKLALAYGGGFLHESNSGPDVCTLAVAKIGLGGAQGSIGAGTSFAPWGTGVMLTGNVLRTFSAPLNATPRRTYVGASLHLWPALAFGGEIGYYRRLGDATGASTTGQRVVGWSVGFGF